MHRTNGLWISAEYSDFSISDEVGKYQLTVAGYSGDYADVVRNAAAPWISNGMKFSTFDDDNDLWGGNCAQRSQPYGGWWYDSSSSSSSSENGGWWYNFCSSSLMNSDVNGMWQIWMTVYDIQAARMLVKLN